MNGPDHHGRGDAYTKAGGGCLTCAHRPRENSARTNEDLVAEGGRLAARDAYRPPSGREGDQATPGPSRSGPTPVASSTRKEAPVADFAPRRPAPKSEAPASAGMTICKNIKLIEEAIEVSCARSLEGLAETANSSNVDNASVFVSFPAPASSAGWTGHHHLGIQDALWPSLAFRCASFRSARSPMRGQYKSGLARNNATTRVDPAVVEIDAAVFYYTNDTLSAGRTATPGI